MQHPQSAEALLQVTNLRVAFGDTEILHGVDLEVGRGRIRALIGESGSGKSVLARSILGLAGARARTTGSIHFEGRELVGLSEAEFAKLRGADIGIVVQDAMSALNPMRTIGEQLAETIAFRHPKFRDGNAAAALFSAKEEIRGIALDLLRTVGITAPEKRMTAYAHQLSGGMRQRVMIALALTGAPKLLLADEPTTALDVVVQRELLTEMRELVRSRGMSMLLVTHDLHLAHDVADDVSVMYAGTILEEGPIDKVIENPAHPYAKGLLDAMPDMTSPRGSLKPIKGEIPPPSELGRGCPFASRCPHADDGCRTLLRAMKALDQDGWRSRCTLAHDAPEADEADETLAADIAPIVTDFREVVEAQIRRHCYHARRGFFGRRMPWDVLQDIELNIRRGEVMGLVGESGCGKSTLSRLMIGLERPTDGTVRFRGEAFPKPGSAPWREQRAAMQMIYQDPYGCFDARLPIVEQVAEPLRVHLRIGKAEAEERALKVLRLVGMPEHLARKIPGVMSGGQLQRAAIARAVALRPALLVCDEPVASLDVSIQAQVLDLLVRLKHTTHMSMLFVSHNLNVVRYICDRVAVMYLGRIVETGTVDEVFRNPMHPYTRLLLASTPGADAGVVRFYPKSSMPSPIDRPKGCVFASRCPLATEKCRQSTPPLKVLDPETERAYACFAAEDNFLRVTQTQEH